MLIPSVRYESGGFAVGKQRAGNLRAFDDRIEFQRFGQDTQPQFTLFVRGIDRVTVTPYNFTNARIRIETTPVATGMNVHVFEVRSLTADEVRARLQSLEPLASKIVESARPLPPPASPIPASAAASDSSLSSVAQPGDVGVIGKKKEKK